MSTVTELGYMGLSISDLDRWKLFACEVVGMEFLQEDEKDRAYLRMDEWHHRIVLHLEGEDDLRYLGLRVAGPNELSAMAEKLEKAGIEYSRATEQEAAERRVLDFIRTVDPSGNNIEIFWGPQIDAHKPFHPGRPMFGKFVSAEKGLGHCVLGQEDVEAAIRFYELLGFQGSVEYVFTMPDGGFVKPVFMHVNGRQHSIAFLPQPPGSKKIQHFMAQYAELKDLGIAHDLVREKQFDMAVQLGMHSNDQMLSFYAGNPSGWAWELGWGGCDAPAQQAYHTRDVFGHAAEAPGYGFDVPM